ncbi:MAG: N-acetyltransferase [Pseudomonadota bacterium]
MNIRKANESDLRAIQQIHLRAFGQPEGKTIVQMVADMAADATARPVLSLLAEDQHQIVGSVLFTPVQIEHAEPGLAASILAPLAVLPSHQKRGVGTALIQTGLDMLRNDGVDIVFVYGDPNYYSRTGFEPSLPHELHPPHAIDYPQGWMVQALCPNAISKARGVVTCCTSLSNPEHW